MRSSEVFDLPDTRILSAISERYIDSGLKFGWKSNKQKSYDYGHWNNYILPNLNDEYFDLAKTSLIAEHGEIKKVWEVLQSITQVDTLIRCYVNCYTFGTDAYSHVDDPEYHKNMSDLKTETIIVYLNKIWNIDWAGETVIFEQNEIEKAVLPRFGRVLVFDSRKLHAARPLTRACPNLRSVLVFKTGDSRVQSKKINFLYQLTDKIPHSNKTFFSHLYNTALILQTLSAGKDVCQAGLFHAIYSTEFFKHSIQVDRNTITELIGSYAEKLVYEFCNLKNRFHTLIHNTNNYTDNFLKDLLLIEKANLLEQNHSGHYTCQIKLINDTFEKTKMVVDGF